MRLSCSPRAGERGIMLVDCLVYISVWILLTGFAFSAFYHTLSYTRQLDRFTTDIARALKAGEQWREDVRQAVANPTVEPGADASEQAFHIRQKTNEIIYIFSRGNVFRRQDAAAPWINLLANTAHSQMELDQRQKISAWRWEVELKASSSKARVKPLFSFESVPQNLAAK